MPIQFQCDGCGRQFAVKEQYAGKKTKCDRCGRVLVIPHTIVAQDEGLERREKFITFTQLAAKPKLQRRKLPVTVFVVVLIIAISGFFVWRYLTTPHRRGVRLFEKRSYVGAAEEFQKAINAGSNVCDSHIYLGRIYAIQKDYERAIGECKKALDIVPKSRDAHKFLIVIYQLNNQPGEAERLWDKASNLPGLDRGFALAKIMPSPSGGKLRPEVIAAYNDILKGTNGQPQKKKPRQIF